MSTPTSSMGWTGQKAVTSGIYVPARTSCCSYRIALSKNETFPPCRNHRAPVLWILVQAA